MALDPRWPRALFRGAVPVALGLLFWVAMAGGEQERQQTLKVRGKGASETLRGRETAVTAPFFPVLQAQAGADAGSSTRRRHNELIMTALREAAETDENVAQRRVPWRK